MENSNSGERDEEPAVREKVPYLQLFPALLSVFSFFFSLLMVLPFLPFMTKDFVDRPRNELGYYAGFLASAFSMGDFFGSTVWGTLADRYGRRPIMIMSPLVSSVFVILFGVSRSFAWAVLARLGWGFFASTMAVTKTFLGELSTERTRASIFALIGFSNGLAGLIGPGLSGLLYRPSAKYASMRTPFWESHPYLLPCLVVVAVNLVSFVTSLLFLKETLHRKPPPMHRMSRGGDGGTDVASNGPPAALSLDDDDDDDDDHRRTKATAAAALGGVPANANGGGFGGGGIHELADMLRHPTVVVRAENGAAAASSSSAAAEHAEFLGNGGGGGVGGKPSLMARLYRRLLRPRGQPYRNLDSTADADAADDVIVVDGDGNGDGAEPTCCRGVRMYLRILRLLRIRLVRLSIVGYSVMALTGMMVGETMPLLLVNNYRHGGMCFNTSEIGVFNSAVAAFQLVSQAVVYPRLARRLGYRRLFRAAVVVFALSCLLFPWASRIVGTQDPLAWNQTRVPFEAASSSSPPPTPSYGNGSAGREHCYAADAALWTAYNVSSGDDGDGGRVFWNFTTLTLDQCGRVLADEQSLLPAARQVSEFKSLSCLDYWVWPTMVLFRAMVNLPMIMGFTCANIFINNCCDDSIRARVTSVGQSMAALARVLGPFISVLFAWTTANGLPFPLNFHMTFWVVAATTMVSVAVSLRMPESVERSFRPPPPPARVGSNGRQAETWDLLSGDEAPEEDEVTV